jgi:alanine dehydrogenase
VNDAGAVWAAADLIVKVKEPIEPEWKYIRPGQIIFTYFHFAASEQLTRAHMASGAVCIAYETVELPSRELPLLTPMSEVAGRMAVQEGATYWEKLYGGRGILLGGVPGVPPAKVVILGGGVVGVNAAKMAAGLGAYGVANMPGGVPITSTLALTNATLPYVLKLANKGYRRALKETQALFNGLNIIDGKVTHRKVAEAFGLEYHPAESIID